MNLAGLTIDLTTAEATVVAPGYGLHVDVTMPGIEIGVPGIPGGLSKRGTSSVITGSLADGATENGVLPLAAGYRIYMMTADQACRVRLYVDAAHRTADALRPAGTDPLGDHGCLADFVFAAAGTLTASPLVDGFVASGIAASYAIENTSGTTTPVQVTLTWVRTE